MKHLMLAFAFIALSFSTAFAGGITKQENEAKIAAGHSKIAAKLVTLESNLKANNTTAAEATAKDILNLIRTGQVQQMARINLEPATDKKQEYNKVYLKMETTSYDYFKLSNNVTANGNKLVEKAKEFLKLY